jgi:murein DD-endopeptidase MepM/ murein hydrolase activator NlpD
MDAGTMKASAVSLLLVLLAAACAPQPSSPSEATVLPAGPEATAGLPTALPSPHPEATGFPTPSLVRAPTAFPAAIADWRPPPYPAPLALRPEDHFYFSRPIPSGEVNWPHPQYRYGGTFFGEESTHTGVDLGAQRGTPVLAAGAGEVVWTGYGLYRGITDQNDPYGLAIAIRHDFGFDGQLLYTVYAHLETSRVWRGQRVAAGEQIGTVGNTGHASGPHLHFEVRLGENYYFSTRNPELWMVPPEGWGVLAGRIVSTWGRPIPEAKVHVTSVDTGQEWEVWTYALDTVHSDAGYNENFVLGDLPAGPYEISLVYAGKLYRAWLFLLPGQTNFVTFKGQAGFQVEPTPTPASRVSR